MLVPATVAAKTTFTKSHVCGRSQLCVDARCADQPTKLCTSDGDCPTGGPCTTGAVCSKDATQPCAQDSECSSVRKGVCERTPVPVAVLNPKTICTVDEDCRTTPSMPSRPGGRCGTNSGLGFDVEVRVTSGKLFEWCTEAPRFASVNGSDQPIVTMNTNLTTAPVGWTFDGQKQIHGRAYVCWSTNDPSKAVAPSTPVVGRTFHLEVKFGELVNLSNGEEHIVTGGGQSTLKLVQYTTEPGGAYTQGEMPGGQIHATGSTNNSPPAVALCGASCATSEACSLADFIVYDDADPNPLGRCSLSAEGDALEVLATNQDGESALWTFPLEECPLVPALPPAGLIVLALAFFGLSRFLVDRRALHTLIMCVGLALAVAALFAPASEGSRWWPSSKERRCQALSLLGVEAGRSNERTRAAILKPSLARQAGSFET